MTAALATIDPGGGPALGPAALCESRPLRVAPSPAAGRGQYVPASALQSDPPMSTARVLAPPASAV
jgi:hypothetical protein